MKGVKLRCCACGSQPFVDNVMSNDSNCRKCRKSDRDTQRPEVGRGRYVNGGREEVALAQPYIPTGLAIRHPIRCGEGQNRKNGGDG